MKKNKKASVSLYIFFFFLAMLLIVVASFIGPLGVNFAMTYYIGGQNIINQSMTQINNITDPAMRTQITTALTGAQQSTADNITILSTIYKYGWVIVLIVTGLVLFLSTRRQVESNVYY